MTPGNTTPIECYTCKKTGGHPVTFYYDFQDHVRWVCPHCIAERQQENERLRHAVKNALEFMGDLETSEVVREWREEPRAAGFYMTYGLLKGALGEEGK